MPRVEDRVLFVRKDVGNQRRHKFTLGTKESMGQVHRKANHLIGVFWRVGNCNKKSIMITGIWAARSVEHPSLDLSSGHDLHGS